MVSICFGLRDYSEGCPSNLASKGILIPETRGIGDTGL